MAPRPRIPTSQRDKWTFHERVKVRKKCPNLIPVARTDPENCGVVLRLPQMAGLGNE